MRTTLAAFFGLAAAPFAAHAAASAEVLDLAARVHYGYYHAEPRTIDAFFAGGDRFDMTLEAFDNEGLQE